MLAYSTISHIGFILLALGIYTEQSIDSFIFYIIQYIITNLNIFLIIIALSYIINQSIIKDKTYFKDIRYISEFKGLFYSNPLISISLSICLFSIAGIPPLVGFFAKYFVLYSSIISEYYFLALIAILTSVISASYYLKLIAIIHFDQQDDYEDQNIKTSIIQNTSNELNTTELLSNLNNNSLVSSNNLLENSYNPTLFVESINKNQEYSNIVLTHSQSFMISVLTLFILFFILQSSVYLKTIELASLYLYYD